MTNYNMASYLSTGEYDGLLTHTCQTIPKENLVLPNPQFIDTVFAPSNRNPQVLKSLGNLFNHGRLAHTGYLSILPVDQGVEHTAGASFSSCPAYYDPDHIMQLAIEGGCNGVATTFGILGTVARKYAHKIPFIVKINHGELLTYPNKPTQTLFGSVEEAWRLGATGIGATIYFGSQGGMDQLKEIANAFERAHELGMATILWCYTRNEAFKKGQSDYHLAADITGQANYIGATIQADIIKQKLPTISGGFGAVGFGKTTPSMYSQFTTNHPIDLCRYQVANCYMGKIGLINSGGPSEGGADLANAIKSAIINKRGGGMGLIVGRKAFQRPIKEGVKLLHAVQDVYLSKEVTVA